MQLADGCQRWFDLRMESPPGSVAAGDVTLRRFVVGDAAALARAIEDSVDHLRPFMPFASLDPPGAGFRRAWIDRVNRFFDEGTSFAYAICKDANIIGGASIDPKGETVASIGYWIHVRHTGNGYATMAARALIDCAIAAGCDTVLLRHDQANHTSAAIARRLGFSFLRLEAHRIDAPGQTGTSMVWGYSRERL